MAEDVETLASIVILGSESFRFGGRRLRSRSVPMFPLKNCGRARSADTQVKSKVFSNNCRDIRLQTSGNTKLVIPKYNRKDYGKIAVARMYSQPKHQHVERPLPPSISNKHPTTTSNKYCNVQSKIDTKDPAPWIHTSKRVVEELAELDGFLLNPRFAGIVESKSFDSVQDILEILEHENEGPVVKIHRRKHQEMKDREMHELQETEQQAAKDQERTNDSESSHVDNTDA